MLTYAALTLTMVACNTLALASAMEFQHCVERLASAADMRFSRWRMMALNAATLVAALALGRTL